MSKNDGSDVQFTFKRHDGTIKGQTRIDVEIKNKSDKTEKKVVKVNK